MNILVCGVGGQGVLLFSNIVSELALTAGLDVKKSEVHGMAQRGGSVTSHIRYAPKVASPLIEEGTADIIVAFEMMEALRYIHFLRPDGKLIYDSHRIDPLPVSTGVVERPTDEKLNQLLTESMEKTGTVHGKQGLSRAESVASDPGDCPSFSARSVCVPAFAAALKLGNARVQNVVMLGAISTFLEFPEEAYHQAITNRVKPKVVDLNLKAFAEGRALCGRA
ncbi:MAG TPA: indolepyruvate oxidoreductase subunit beta [bacterium]|nr:indolepyruvate oxidoreductase subunit beta [bacterium]